MSASMMTPLFEISDRFCLYHSAQHCSGAALRQQVAATAQRLLRLGVTPGCRVALCAPKSIELCVLMLASWSVGAVLVPLFAGLNSRQLRHILHDSQPQLVFAGERDFARVDEAHAGKTWALAAWLTADADEDGTLVDSAHGAAARLTASAVTDQSPALIIYTSGSTGPAKGVVFSRANLLLGAKSVVRFMGLTHDDRVLCLLPFSFDAGLNQFLSALIANASVVLLDFMHESQVEACCARHGITSLIAVPGLWQRIGRVRWREQARQSLCRLGNTGGHLPADLLWRLQSLFPEASVFLMYGFTEAFRASYLRPSQVAAKPHAVGRAIPFASLAVVSEQGRLCQPHEIGELVQCGPLVTLGYHNRPDENRLKFRALPAGLLQALMGPPGRCYAFDPSHAAQVAWSGDLVSIDEDGDLIYHGRKDDLIKVNGFRICPGEVETACVEAGLGMALAIGVQVDGEEAVVVFSSRTDPVPDLEAIRARLRLSLPGYMQPKLILLLDDFPLTANGKFDRQALASLAAQRLADLSPAIEAEATR